MTALTRHAAALVVMLVALSAPLVTSSASAARSPSSVGSATVQLASSSGCGGSLVMTKRLSYRGHVIGRLKLYYNAGNGRNCAVMRHAGPSWGVKRWTAVNLSRCTQTRPSTYCDIAKPHHAKSDTGRFSYYAGPVSVRAAGHCISVSGRIQWAGKVRMVSTSGARFCD